MSVHHKMPMSQMLFSFYHNPWLRLITITDTSLVITKRNTCDFSRCGATVGTANRSL